MKKIKIILASMLILALAATAVCADGNIFTISDVKGRPGDVVKVDITLEAEDVIDTIGLRDIEYDDSVLTFKGFTDYEEMEEKAILSSFDNKTGAVVIGLEDDEAFNGKICSVQFYIEDDAEEGEYGVDATSILKNANEELSSSVEGGSVTVRCQILGDINLDEHIDLNDAILLLQHSMFEELYPLEYVGSVDFTRDGAVDMNDAVLLLQHSMFPDLYPLEEPVERDFTDGVAIIPRGGSENVMINKNVVFTFPETVYGEDGEQIDAAYVEACFEIRKGSATGIRIAYTASVNEDSTVVTLDPDEDFDFDTKYFVMLDEGILSYEDGTKNQNFGTIFATRKEGKFEKIIIPTDLYYEYSFDVDGDGEIADDSSENFSTADMVFGNDDDIIREPQEAFDAEAGIVWYIYVWVDGKTRYVPVVTDDVKPQILVDGDIAPEYLNKLCTYTIDEDGVYTITSVGYDEENAVINDVSVLDGDDAEAVYYSDGNSGTINKVAGSRFEIPGFDRSVDLKSYTKIIIREFDIKEQNFRYIEYDASSFKDSLDEGELTNVSYIISNNPDSSTRENLVVLYAEKTVATFKSETYEDSVRIVSDVRSEDDENGLWRFCYDLYNPYTGEKVYDVPSVHGEKKASMLDDAEAFQRGDIIKLYDGLVDEDKENTTVSADALVYITEVDEAENFFAVAKYNDVTENGTLECKECIDENVDNFDVDTVNLVDFSTGATIVDGNGNCTNYIEYDENTVVSVMTKDYRFEEINLWADGKMSLSSIEAIADADKSILCYNKNALDRNGKFKTGYSDYVKAYVSVVDEVLEEDELPRADFIIVIVNAEEEAALDVDCMLHD